MYLALKKSNKISVDTMTKMDKLFVQMAKSMRKSIEQLADINRCASYTNSSDKFFSPWNKSYVPISPSYILTYI